ncbi:MAG: hypothetical protein U0528_08925 [Anaerolineae bacterium]
MKLQIVQLEPYDDTTSIKDRLSSVKADRVLLVWPKRKSARLLQRKLDLVLIQREAERRKARLALVTADPDVIDYARELNITVFNSVRQGQQPGVWKQPLNKVFVERADRPEGTPDPFELRLIASRLRKLTPQERRNRLILRFGAILLLLVTLISTAVVVLPGAEVVIYPAQSQIDDVALITADPQASAIDYDQGIIPALVQVIDVETSASIPTTGVTDVANSLASGTVIFTNQTNDEITIPAGTVVFSTGRDPARFRTINDVIVPAGVGSTANTNIQALEDTSGTKGNIEPNLIINIEGPLNDVLGVRNPISRAAVRCVRRHRHAGGYNNLLPLARDKIRQVALTQFSARLTSGQIVVPESIQIAPGATEETTYSAFIGDPVETLTLTLRTRVRALVIDQQFARDAAFASLSRQVRLQQTRILDLNSVTYQLTAVRPPDANGRVLLTMAVSGRIYTQIDAERARQRISGSSISAAIDALNRDWVLDPLRPPEIRVFPGIFGRLPFLTTRITIVIRTST